MGKEKNDKGVLTMESDLKQFAKMMSVLGELYSKPLSEILIEIYWRVLKNYSLQEIKADVYSYINHENEGSFMPKPADIIRHIHQQEKQKALDAWSKVENAIRQVGRYSSISFDDQLIHFVIKKMGGDGLSYVPIRPIKCLPLLMILSKNIPIAFRIFPMIYHNLLKGSLIKAIL